MRLKVHFRYTVDNIVCVGVCVCPSSMFQTVSEWLWWERLWLPVNVSWSDLEDGEGRVYAKGSHLFSALPCALCMLLVRYLFERCDIKACLWASDVFISNGGLS